VRAYGAELVELEKDDSLGARTRLLDYVRHNARVANHVLTRVWKSSIAACVMCAGFR
jgi:hypothetical protein